MKACKPLTQKSHRALEHSQATGLAMMENLQGISSTCPPGTKTVALRPQPRAKGVRVSRGQGVQGVQGIQGLGFRDFGVCGLRGSRGLRFRVRVQGIGITGYLGIRI